MNGTIGFISLNFVNKNIDLWIAYVIILAGFLYSYVGVNQLERLNQKLMIFYCDIYSIFKKHISTPSSLFVFFLSTILLILNVLNQSQDLLYTLLTILIFMGFLVLGGSRFYFWAVLVFLTKTFFSGEYVVSDAFHGAESFIASFSLKNGFFAVFPNIGYLEELPPLILSKFIQAISFGNLTFSLATSKSLIVNLLQLSIFYFLYRKHKLIAVTGILCLPYDRLSLLILLFYTCYVLFFFEKYFSGQFVKSYVKVYSILLLGIFPLIALMSSPSYLILPVLGFIVLAPLLLEDFKYVSILAFVWILLLLSFYHAFDYYFSVYREFSKEHLLAYATPLNSLKLLDLLFKLSIIFVISTVIFSLVNIKDKFASNLFRLLVVLLIMRIYVQYGFGRIDPGYSRVIPLGLSLLIVLALIFERYRNIIATVFILVAIKYSVIHIPNFSYENFFNVKFYKSSEHVQLDSSLKVTVSKINNFIKNKNVIIYSDPAIALEVKNSLLPPFTSPYVTIGKGNQDKVVFFLRTNPQAVVYLGSSFETFDGVDIRLRAPIVFRHLSNNYNFKNVEGLIYAIPKEFDVADDKSGGIFFTGMNLGKSAHFYQKFYSDKFLYRKLRVECGEKGYQKYSILNSGNLLFAELKCGVNLIPEVFFLGSTVRIIKIQGA